MNFLAILAALALEQWRTLRARASIERAFMRYARSLEQRINGGTVGQGVVAMLLAVLPPVLLAAALGWLAAHIHPLLALLFNALVLYLLMGFRRFSHAVSTIVNAFRAGDLTGARRALAQWRGGYTSEMSSQEVARGAIESRIDRCVSAGVRGAVLVHGAARTCGRRAVPRCGIARAGMDGCGARR